MARWNFDVWGSSVWGAGTPVPFLVEPIAGATQPSGALGVQARVIDPNTIQVSWNPYDDNTLSTMRVVRSTVGPPAWELDGAPLVDAPNGAAVGWTDRGLKANTFYYYTVFMFDTKTQSWLRGGSAGCITPNDTLGMGKFLYQRLPQWYHDEDDQQQVSGPGPLQRFLALLGFELDVLRTEIESLANIWDPVKGSAQAVPYALGQFLMEPEPELGYANQRQLLRAAAILYATKGSALCIRTLCSTVTGWATDVGRGINLLADNLDAQFDGTTGRWVATNAALTWRVGDGTINAPNGVGMAVLTANSTSNPSIALYADDPIYTGVPATAGQSYGVSALVRGSAGDAVTMSAQFYDITGAALGSPITGSPVTPDASDWNQTVSVVATAPDNAWSMSISLATAGIVSGHVTYVSSVMAQPLTSSTSSLAKYQPARDIRVIVTADKVNEIMNPKLAVDTNNWSTSVGTDVTDGTGTLNRIVYSSSAPPLTTSSIVGELVATAAGQGVWTACTQCTPDAYYTASTWVLVESGAGVVLVARDVGAGNVYTSAPITAGAWTEVNVSLLTGLSSTVEVDVSLVALGATSVVFNATMLTQGGPEVPYFDGDIASPTDDYLWERTPNASRSHYYRQRTMRSYRFRELLPRFIVSGQTATLLFAQGVPVPPSATGLYPGSSTYPSSTTYPEGSS